MRLKSWMTGTVLAVAWIFCASTDTAAGGDDLTHFVFTASVELDTAQVSDLR